MQIVIQTFQGISVPATSFQQNQATIASKLISQSEIRNKIKPIVVATTSSS